MDDSIDDSRLSELLRDRAKVPYPGSWTARPFPEVRHGNVRCAVIARDPGLTTIAVERASGRVWLIPDEGEAVVVNSTVAALVACSHAYAETAAHAAGLEFADDEDDEEGEALADALIERLRAIDPEAVSDENSFWSVAAEELGYGLTV